MPQSRTYKLTLPPKTEYLTCKYYKDGMTKECDSPNQLLKSYTGELVYDVNSNVASFSSPSFGDCKDSNKLKCKLELELSKQTADPLIPKSVKPNASNRPLPQNSFKKATVASSEKEPNQIPSHDISSSGLFGMPFPYLFLGLIVSTVAITAIYFLRKPNKLLISGSDQTTESRGKHRHSRQQVPLSSQTTSMASNHQNQMIAREVRMQLAPMNERLNSFETKLLSLEQTILNADRRRNQTDSGIVTTAPINILSANPGPAPPPPPPVLSIELIKQAIATTCYNLISSYPHEFVSETPESQQGLVDRKQFFVQGDETQSGTKSNSEFIAIPFNNACYLIPNILPNAAEPARTLKRHADRNNIYRAGQGSNILHIQDLAVVQKIGGDKYEILQTGQIA